MQNFELDESSASLIEQFNPKNKKSLSLRTHCQTSGWSLTEQDPFNNVARTCIEALAAVFGGTQSLHTNVLTKLSLYPQIFQPVLREIPNYTYKKKLELPFIDPYHNSYYIETLTNELIAKAGKLIQEVEELGGCPKR